MSRKIKFRAWDKETKEMSYDYLDKNWLKVCIESPYVELMQFTGLIDKNGVREMKYKCIKCNEVILITNTVSAIPEKEIKCIETSIKCNNCGTLNIMGK